MVLDILVRIQKNLTSTISDQVGRLQSVHRTKKWPIFAKLPFLKEHHRRTRNNWFLVFNSVLDIFVRIQKNLTSRISDPVGRLQSVHSAKIHLFSQNFDILTDFEGPLQTNQIKLVSSFQNGPRYICKDSEKPYFKGVWADRQARERT